MAKLTRRVTTTVKKGTYENLQKYVAKNKDTTKSSVINEALEQFFSIKGGKDEIDIISKIIRESLEDVLKPFENRTCKLLAKLTKGNFTNLYLILEMLVGLSETDKAKERIKQIYEEANKKAYYVLKDGYINRDVLELFPKANEEEGSQ